MAGTMIMVSGMPGAGKSTLAWWLSEQLGVPVVNYDRLLRKVQAVSPETGKGLPYPSKQAMR
ncbi:AAA family ATPase [Acutalibacter caecimuris]|uniref:AAA family ATPase n=1 Tax=Acutalibacter caecimuris TaxID=3093657 RepID=UPI002AC8C476|nr:AAA family ATPase [Acutalibacter sp. M00118]